MLYVDAKPKILRWACNRAGPDKILPRFKMYNDWVEGSSRPTLKQLEKYANVTHTPIGYFYLDEPPEIEIPIPDFRTIGNLSMKDPSPDLLDTIYLCQQRQEWYREYSLSIGDDRNDLIGSADLSDDVLTACSNIREVFNFNMRDRRQIPTWSDALRFFVDNVEQRGILVMLNGVVGNNNYRKLDSKEFRGFALSDDIAPLIFVNGADTKAAQIFTLAHELAHILLGESGVSIVGPDTVTDIDIEGWCNRCAAEILVPIDHIRRSFKEDIDLDRELDRLAKVYKVSTLVILRRIYDLGHFTRNEFWQIYNDKLEKLGSIRSAGGGNFYNTQSSRLGKRFARALVISTLEGHTLYNEAFRLLGFSKMSTFRELGQKMGVG